MKNVKLIFILFIFLFISSSYAQTTFYISSLGNDLSTGTTTSTPWKSISKINSYGSITGFVAGDKILFKRGETFNGQVNIYNTGSASIPITFGSFGIGARPILLGSSKISSTWVKFRNNVWRTSNSFGNEFNMLSYNGKALNIARFPKTGFLYRDTSKLQSGFICSAIKRYPDGYFVGANLRLKNLYYGWETAKVASSKRGLVLYENDSEAIASEANWGFYMDNLLDFCTELGDFVIKKDFIYLISPDGSDPNLQDVEVSTFQSAFTTNANSSSNNITIRDLDMRFYTGKAIDFRTACVACTRYDSVKVINNCFSQNWDISVYIEGIHTIVDSNIVADTKGSGFFIASKYSKIRANYFKKIALTGGLGVGGGNAFNSEFGYADIRYNYADSIAGGVMVRGNDNFFYKNIVKHPVMLYNDLGAVYCGTWRCHTNIFRNNIIYYPKGSYEGAPSTAPLINGGFSFEAIMGFYIDAGGAAFNTLDSNTVVEASASSIFFSTGSFSNTVTSNLIYGGKNGISVADFVDPINIYSTEKNLLENNTLISTSSSKNVISILGRSGLFDLVISRNNNFHCPYNKNCFVRGGDNSLPFSIKNWRSNSNQDLSSKMSDFSFDKYKIISVDGNNLQSYTGGDLKSTWSPSFSNSTYLYWIITTLGSNIQFKKSQNDGSIVYNPTFNSTNLVTLESGKFYKISFSAYSDIETFANLNINYGSGISLVNPFGLSLNTNNKDYSFYFYVNTKTDGVYIEFELDKILNNFTISNIVLVPVSLLEVDPTTQTELFINETNFSKTYNLSNGNYKDLNGVPVTGSIIVPPYYSKALVNMDKVSTSLFSKEFSSTNTISIYPNPLTNKNTSFVVSNLTGNGIDSIEIFDLIGRMIFRSINLPSSIEIESSHFASGVYILKSKIADKINVNKLIIE